MNPVRGRNAEITDEEKAWIINSVKDSLCLSLMERLEEILGTDRD